MPGGQSIETPKYDRSSLTGKSFVENKIGDFSLNSVATEGSDEERSKMIAVEPPEKTSMSALHRLFYRTDNLPITFLGTVFNFDVFRGDLDGSQISDGTTKKSKFSMPVLEQLQRLQTSANIDEQSLEAFTVMFNAAKNGGKIAVVLAHGGPYKNPSTGSVELRISTKQGKVNIDDLISDLFAQKDSDGNQAYQLIYFNACNETGIPIGRNKNSRLIPVITYTNINKGMQGEPGKLKVYWPSSANLSLKSKIASILKR